jgi:hypothetical protein
MTHTVAATSNALAPTEPQRASAAPAAGSSFAQVQAAAVNDSESKSKASSGDDAKTAASAPKGEKTQRVAGHHYAEIVSGPRNGMFINNTGSKRDGEAFLIVKRHGREFHIYGTGQERSVYEVGRDRSTAPATGTNGTTGTSGTGASGTSATAAAGTTGASATPAAGTTATT